jgi:hypothetical protein
VQPPLSQESKKDGSAVKVAILVVCRNQPERVERMLSRLKKTVSLPNDVFLVEWGTDPRQMRPCSDLWYADSSSRSNGLKPWKQRGESFGFNLALRAARLEEDYDYYWMLRSDVELDDGEDLAGGMVAVLERNHRMGMLALARAGDGPRESRGKGGKGGQGSKDRREWQPVATCEHLGLMLRAVAVEQVGFLNADFPACIGAIDELCYRMHEQDWLVGEMLEPSLRVEEPSPFEAQSALQAASRFAFEYFRTNYGDRWDEEFWMSSQGHGIEEDRFRERKALWSVSASCAEPAPCAEAKETLEPYPLATDATTLLFAWPRYDSPTELDALFEAYGKPIAGRSDVCLCLRHDASSDPSQTAAVAALEESCSRVLGPSTGIEVLLVDEPLSPRDWARLGATVSAVLPLPSSAEEPRITSLRAMGARILGSEDQLHRIVPDLPPASSPVRYSARELDAVDWRLVEQIKELHPWSHSVRIGNLQVQAGQGTGRDCAAIERASVERVGRLVEDVAKRFDWRHKSVLELFSECGFFAARYAERGASRAVLVDSDERALRRAELYWSRNGFLDPREVRFLRGDLAGASTWDEISAAGPHDVTICAGIPASFTEIEPLLRRAAEVTRDALVLEVDLRRRSSASRRQILDCLEEFGFLPGVLPAVPALASSGIVLPGSDPGNLTVLARRSVVCFEPEAILPRSESRSCDPRIASSSKTA